jgi:hypothetical protein
MCTDERVFSRFHAVLLAYAVTNRKLREHGEMGELLRKNASQRWWSDLGDYYVVDIRGNYIVNRHVDLESFAKECGCLKPWEALQQ